MMSGQPKFVGLVPKLQTTRVQTASKLLASWFFD